MTGATGEGSERRKSLHSPPQEVEARICLLPREGLDVTGKPGFGLRQENYNLD